MSFLKNSKHKNIYKIAIAYFAIAWLLVQSLVTASYAYNLPPILVGGMVFMMIGGYPLVLMMAWAYEATHRTRGWEKDNAIANKELGEGRKFPLFIGGIIILAIAILLFDIFILRAQAAHDSVSQGAVSSSAAQN